MIAFTTSYAAVAAQAISDSALLKALDIRTHLLRTNLPVLLKASAVAATTVLNTQQFWNIQPSSDSGYPWLLDTATGLLWNPVSKSEGFGPIHNIADSTAKCRSLAPVNGTAWLPPSGAEILAFASNGNNPWKAVGSNHQLFAQNSYLVSDQEAGVDLNNGKFDRASVYLIATNAQFVKNLIGFALYAAQQNWKVFATKDPKKTNVLADLIDLIYAQGTALQDIFAGIDTYSARLPKLEKSDFIDPNKGIWELHGLDAVQLNTANLRARNPADDCKQGMVAIDFGTSSTVVAVEEDGIGKLLRIGVTDFFETPKPSHYENPTVLEFVDLPAMLAAWQATAYRPHVLWDDVRCSHEAMHNFRHNQTDSRVVASVLTKIKQWALREGDGTRVLIADQTTTTEHELAPLTQRQPVKGTPLSVSASDPYDPIEMYAWFLGLTINWRRRGIFLRYYMTFPVDYPREVKDKILASFRRGLQRSLPATLVTQAVFEKFIVEERASEPAAYAAIALQTLGIEPTQEGVAYAIFDFGGGTTDFDFGYYRLPTDAEERTGVEQVFEHFGGGGDRYLGGENLLEHMAYLTFRHNLEVCRAQKVAFSMPLDAKSFDGSEMFLEHTQAAVTNTLMLIARLRPFLEQSTLGQTEKSPLAVQKIELINRGGQKVTCEFTVPYAALGQFLQDRMAQGVHDFFNTLKSSFGENTPQEVQVLLAGNASRSATILGLFGLLPEEHELYGLKAKTTAFLGVLFAGNAPEFTSHAPLAADPLDVNRPTAKTGVALGLLQLCPGSSTKVVNHAVQNASGEAPFQHFVGRIRRKMFHTALQQGAAYGQWTEIGPVGEDRVFKLFHTQAARALGGMMALGDAALILKTLEFAGGVAGQQVMARATKPHEIEICTANSAQDATDSGGNVANLQTLFLK